MRTNAISYRPQPVTHEGAPAVRLSARNELRHTVMACMLWEDGFYENGQSVADRISALVKQLPAVVVYDIALEARTQMHLRHVPLFLMSELFKRPALPPHTWLAEVIQRADEMAEFLAIFTKGRTGVKKLNKLPNQVKRGLALALAKFDEYQLAKYDRNADIKIRDVIRLAHPKPRTGYEAELWGRVLNGTLAKPDTWEVALSESKGEDKKAVWEGLLQRGSLGPLALLRNLRNMQQAGVSDGLIRNALATCKPDKVLPFRFIAAARAVPALEDAIEPAMLRCLEGAEKLPGRTILLVDVSGSMWSRVSEKSDLRRVDAAAALAILLREVCEQVAVMPFGHDVCTVPSRRGFALADAIITSPPARGGTDIRYAVDRAIGMCHDRVIVITDEQSATPMPRPQISTKAYIINVATDKNGVGYGDWLHIDGWSEQCVNYIREYEKWAK